MKVILRSNCGDDASEHDIPPSEVEAFVALCRTHEMYDGDHDPAVMEVVTQMNIVDGVFEVIAVTENE